MKLSPRVASERFATTIEKDCVITETLERVTDVTQNGSLREAKTGKGNQICFAGRRHPTTFCPITRCPSGPRTLGIVPETPGGRWIRAKPLSLSDASEELSNRFRCGNQACRTPWRSCSGSQQAGGQARALGARQIRSSASDCISSSSGAGRAYSTIEPHALRKVVFDGQKFLPGLRDREAALRSSFCHNCGQEHHPVWFQNSNENAIVERRDIDDRPIS